MRYLIVTGVQSFALPISAPDRRPGRPPGALAGGGSAVAGRARGTHDAPARRAVGGRAATLRRGAGAGARSGSRPGGRAVGQPGSRSEEHTSELQSRSDLVCRLLLEKKKKKKQTKND